MGRIDDVLKVSGHRLGTMEVESALVAHPRVAEAAVVGRPHDIKGEAIFAYVVCRGQRPPEKDAEKLAGELREWVGKQLGAIAKPDDIRFTEVLPKTRSGKIMRRVIAAVSNFAEVGDVSTLANPEIVDDIRHHVQSEKVARGEVPRELSEAEKQEIAAYGNAE
jgi:acetyl-CoA synthetase